MNVIAFKPKPKDRPRGGVTLFFHVRQTTLIAHLAAPRRHREIAQIRCRTSVKVT